jgi:polar amino acid transport system substrate-binding protein
MRMRKTLFAALAVAAMSVALVGCSAPKTTLAAIKTAGVIRIATDPNYAPYSFLDTESGEYDGFDTAVARMIATALEVDIEWVTPTWDELTAGSWGGRWDVSVGSMAQTEARTKVIDFSVPYYYAQATIAVPQDSTATTLADLNGLKACVGSSTIYEKWLNGELAGDALITVNTPMTITTPVVQTEDTDNLCIEGLMAGRTWDFFIQSKDFIANSIYTLEGNAEDGVAAIKVMDPALVLTTEKISVALDKGSEGADPALLAEINRIIALGHSSGALSALSEGYLGVDVTVAP